MNANDPLQRFEAEHQHALGELRRLETAVSALEAGTNPAASLPTVTEVHEFLSTAVRQHNENEEAALFAELGDRAPCAPFVEEHETLRRLERDLADALASANPETAVPPVARALIDLLRAHIDREDQALFPMARDMLGTEGLARVAARLGP